MKFDVMRIYKYVFTYNLKNNVINDLINVIIKKLTAHVCTEVSSVLGVYFSLARGHEQNHLRK